MFSTPMKSAGENVKDELITQNTLIGDIAQSLGLTVTEASGNSKNQLQIMNNNLQEIKNGNTNFLPENIKSGVTMWGKTGTFDNSNGQYIWKKCNEYEFIDYVVSDNENKYPDGAVHTDGYYYEKIVGVAEMFGFTKVTVDKFMYASDVIGKNITGGISISHSLGERPKLAMICSDFDTTGQSNYSSRPFLMLSTVAEIYTDGTTEASNITDFSPVLIHPAEGYIALKKETENTNIKYRQWGYISAINRSNITVRATTADYGDSLKVFVAGREYRLLTFA